MWHGDLEDRGEPKSQSMVLRLDSSLKFKVVFRLSIFWMMSKSRVGEAHVFLLANRQTHHGAKVKMDHESATMRYCWISYIVREKGKNRICHQSEVTNIKNAKSKVRVSHQTSKGLSSAFSSGLFPRSRRVDLQINKMRMNLIIKIQSKQKDGTT